MITGPNSSETVAGLKTFKTISSITPNSNTSGNISLGFSGVGITTTGVTGSATLNSTSMSNDIYNNTFVSTTGDTAGIKVKYTGSGANGTIYYGESLISKFTTYISSVLENTGVLNTRVSTLTDEVSDQNVLIADLDEKFEATRSRYIQQFTAMEQAVTSMKSTVIILQIYLKP